ncbi:hypothetical protein FGW37_30045 [Streptomyces rectiverticillatus]|nr:hypothetical protein FGW37_30045 [Streptomyces rectiverticillatus]
MSRTTPPRPVDITAVFPQPAPPARTATRLPPRAGAPSPHDSSVGGPLLRPADEPWPAHPHHGQLRPDHSYRRTLRAGTAGHLGRRDQATYPATPEFLSAPASVP